LKKKVISPPYLLLIWLAESNTIFLAISRRKNFIFLEIGFFYKVAGEQEKISSLVFSDLMLS